MDDRLREAMSVPCGGTGERQSCWYNPETGYTEYCEVHEGIIADFVYAPAGTPREENEKQEATENR
jgi:hypothetical protein